MLQGKILKLISLIQIRILLVMKLKDRVIVQENLLMKKATTLKLTIHKIVTKNNLSPPRINWPNSKEQSTNK